MRRGTTRHGWVLAEDGGLLGLTMGSDFCAEHEGGTGELRRAFGLDETKDGVERRTVRTLPKGLTLIEDRNVTAFGWSGYESVDGAQWLREHLKDGQLRRYRWMDPPPVLACAWDERSFGVAAWGPKRGADRKNAKELFEALRRKDVAFWSSVGPFHLGTGFVLAIASRVPEKHAAEMKEGDLSHRELLRVAESTGIKEELQKAGRRWFALSPQWASPSDDKQSECRVRWFLNPYDQQANNHGWFTLEELRLWASGRGPVPKRAAGAR